MTAAPVRRSTIPLIPLAPLALLAALGAPATVRAAGPAEVAREILDVTPERLEAFRATLLEFTGGMADEPVDYDGLNLRSSYTSEVAEGYFDDPTGEIEVPAAMYGRDLVADEQFLIAGREDEFRDASRRWFERKVKGSDARARSSSRSRWKTKYAWDDGPLLGLGRGSWAAQAGEDQWRLRWRRGIGAPDSGWLATASVGVEDGEEKVGFMIGRSLTRALAR